VDHPEVSVGELLLHLCADGRFQQVAGVGAFSRIIRQRTVQRLGVDVVGYVEHLESDRVQLLGNSEAGYLDTLSSEIRTARLAEITRLGLPVLVLTAGRTPPPELVDLSESHRFALVTTELGSTEATALINRELHRYLAVRETRHGVLVDVHGVGLLLIGKAGMGKSEIGLELISRGHRLIADDLVLLEQRAPDRVVGACPEITRHHMEIRGLGIINIKDLFGAAAVRDRKRIEIAIELVPWDPSEDFDRLGLEHKHVVLAGVPVTHIRLPVRPGKSLALIIEVAARNSLLQVQGTHSAQAFVERVGRHIAAQGAPEGEFVGLDE